MPTRSEELGLYITKYNATVRDCAAHFKISKSTVHKDVTEWLRHDNPRLHERVREVLEKNKAERHLRGGAATKRHYEALRKSKKASADSADAKRTYE